MSRASVQVRNAWFTIVAISLAATGMLVWVIYFKEQPEDTQDVLPFLPLLNCILNGISAGCLVVGFNKIRRGQVRKHTRWMLAAFGCSTLFLASYLMHHHLHGDTRFPSESGLRAVYFPVLVSHIVLSIVCLPMILMTFYLSLSGRFSGHKKLARFTFPVWLYVSVTGVLVYVLQKSAGL